MERLRERFDVAAKALETLDELVQATDSDKVTRDAAIQRFEYSFEAVWKAAQRFLFIQEGLDLGSPKAVVRAAFQTGILNEAETEQALRMADDRNLTVHTYNESLATLLEGRLKDYADLLRKWLERMRSKIFDDLPK